MKTRVLALCLIKSAAVFLFLSSCMVETKPTGLFKIKYIFLFCFMFSGLRSISILQFGVARSPGFAILPFSVTRFCSINSSARRLEQNPALAINFCTL